MAESFILFPLDMLENVAVTVGVDSSKSVIELKEIKKLAKVLGFNLQIRFHYLNALFCNI